MTRTALGRSYGRSSNPGYRAEVPPPQPVDGGGGHAATGPASAQDFQELLGERLRGRGFLARVEVPVDDDVGLPGAAFLEVRAELDEPVLKQPGSLGGQARLGLLGVGEAGHL